MLLDDSLITLSELPLDHCYDGTIVFSQFAMFIFRFTSRLMSSAGKS